MDFLIRCFLISIIIHRPKLSGKNRIEEKDERGKNSKFRLENGEFKRKVAILGRKIWGK